MKGGSRVMSHKHHNRLNSAGHRDERARNVPMLDPLELTASGSFKPRNYEEAHKSAAETLQRFFRHRWRRNFMAAIRRQKTRAQLREICVYVVFLMVFTYSSVLEAQDQDIFWLGDNVRGQLREQEFNPEHAHIQKTLGDVRTIEELYQWMSGPLMGTLYTAGTWDGSATNPHPGFVFGVNQIIGGVRIGQLRSAPVPCSRKNGFVFENVSQEMKCYGGDRGQFTLETESTEPFGLLPEKFVWDGWNTTHMTIAQQRESSLTERRLSTAKNVPAPAYSIVLPNRDATEGARLVQAIVEGQYIDGQTRAVMFDITLMNPMMNYFLVVRMTFEITHSGGVLPTYEYFVVRLYQYFDSMTYQKTVSEALTVAFYIYYILQVVRRSLKFGWQYFVRGDTVMHNFNLLIFVLVWVAKIVSVQVVPPAVEVVPDSDVFYDFGPAAVARVTSIYLNALNAFLCWFKLVRYLSYVPQFALVTGTLSKAADEVAGFAVIFILTFYGFAAAHMMSFGALLFEYRNMTQSVLSLITSLLGEFDLDELQRAQWLLGPVFFVVFVSLAVFVVLNVLIAIISDSYVEMRESLDKEVDVRIGKEMWIYIANVIESAPIIGPAVLKCCSMKKRAKATVTKRAIAAKKTLARSASQVTLPRVRSKQSLASAKSPTTPSGAGSGRHGFDSIPTPRIAEEPELEASEAKPVRPSTT